MKSNYYITKIIYYMQILADRTLIDECDASSWYRILRFSFGNISEFFSVILMHTNKHSMQAQSSTQQMQNKFY